MDFKNLVKHTVDPFLGKGKYGWVNPAGKIAHLSLRSVRNFLDPQSHSARSVYAADQNYYGSTGSIVGRY